MEDYTYHFEPGRGRVLGSHMLEVCPSIATAKPTLEVHPLGIGGKSDPARLVFGTKPGPALNASMIELDGRFRLVVNEVEVVAPDEDLPKLPVARTVWISKPDLSEGARRWIGAGGAHHCVHAPALTPKYLCDFVCITEGNSSRSVNGKGAEKRGMARQRASPSSYGTVMILTPCFRIVSSIG